MKKILISIFIVLLLVLGYFAIWEGLQFGDLKILGLKQIEDKNNKLDNTILNATELATKTYDEQLKTLTTDVKQLEQQKKKYDELTAVSTESQAESANQYQKYEIEYLWTIIGNHATSEGVVIKMDLVAGGTTDTYNLNFTVTGEYIGIADFISDIENDSALGFKIENFYMIPDSGAEKLKATFTCKEIMIKDLTNSSRNVQPVNNETNSTTNNTTNSTTNNTTNTPSAQNANANASGVSNTTNTTNTAGVASNTTTNSSTTNANTTTNVNADAVRNTNSDTLEKR